MLLANRWRGTWKLLVFGSTRVTWVAPRRSFHASHWFPSQITCIYIFHKASYVTKAESLFKLKHSEHIFARHVSKLCKPWVFHTIIKHLQNIYARVKGVVHFFLTSRVELWCERLGSQFVGLKKSTLAAWQCTVENQFFFVRTDMLLLYAIWDVSVEE